MKTYIQTLKDLSKKPKNVKYLQRDNALSEYLSEVSSKLSLGIKLDDKILNQEIIKKHNFLDNVEQTNEYYNNLKSVLAQVKNNIPYDSISTILKNMKYIGFNEVYRLANNYSFILDGSRSIKVYYKHYFLDKKDCISFNIDNSKLYINYDSVAA